MKRFVIALSREYGSGGFEVAQRLADHFGVEYYDKDLIRLAAEKRGISSEVVEAADETKAKPWEPPIPGGLTVFNDRLFDIQSQIIREKASAESCIIIGRCGDKVLENNPECISVFIFAEKEFKVKRIREAADITTEEAEKLIKKVDKSRKAYYHYYTDGKWGQDSNYDIALSTSKFGIDGVVNAVISIVNNFIEME
ncbi:MAG: cytidylate kinase-like family protein [Lachnospiraceae bacterium]|nr:cytidylate kinase-like family protein [Lachnospiraceae bacterium]